MHEKGFISREISVKIKHIYFWLLVTHGHTHLSRDGEVILR